MKDMNFRVYILIGLFFGILLLSSGCGGSASKGGDVKSGADAARSSGEKVVVKESAIEHFSQGLAAMKSNPAQAKDFFLNATKEEPNFAEAWYNLGILSEQSGDKEGAKKHYEKAISSRRDMGEAYVNLGLVYLEEGKMNEAEQQFIKVVNESNGVDPFNVEANLNLGMIHRIRGEEVLKARAGGKEFEFSVTGSESDEKVTDPEAMKHFSEAVRYIRRALAGDSNNIYCYENLSAIYFMMNHLDVATLVSEQAIEKQKDRNEELKKSLDEKLISMDEYNERLIKDVDMAAVYNTYGLIWLTRGDVSLANYWFKKAVEVNPKQVESLLNVAGVSVNVQDFTTAYDMYNKVLVLDPGNLEAQLSKGVAARGLNRLDEAEKIYRELLTAHPDFAAAQFNLAILYQEYHRKLEEAKSMYEKFIAMPSASKDIPARVQEAKDRIQQIEDIWIAQKKAEEEGKRMQKAMEEMEKLEQAQSGS